MQRLPGESMLSVFRNEQGGRSGKEVKVGDEIQILVGGSEANPVGPENHLRSLALTLKAMDSHCRVLSKGMT